MAPWGKSSPAGPLHISYPIKAPPAHAFQLQDKIYCPESGLIQQDVADTQWPRGGDWSRDGKKVE